MNIPPYTEITEVKRRKLAQDELVDKTFDAVGNIPIACEIITSLIDDYKNGGDVDDFLFRIEYIVNSISVYTDNLSDCLKAAGHSKK